MKTALAIDSFGALANDLPLLVFVANLKGEATYCNRTFQDFTGLSEGDLIGGSWLQAIHHEDRERVQSAWRQAIVAEEPYEVEYRLRAGDGGFRWFRVRCIPVRSNGQVDHWVGTGADIDDQKMSASKGRDHESGLSKPFSSEALSAAVLDRVEGSAPLGEDEASLDGLAARFQSIALHRVLRAWRSGRRGKRLPALKDVAVAQDEMDFVALVAVDQTRVPIGFELILVGAALVKRAETDFAWWRLDATGDNSETCQEGAYSRCVRSMKPTYEYARFDFGDVDCESFERLLLPCSEDGDNVTSMLAVVVFDSPNAANEDYP